MTDSTTDTSASETEAPESQTYGFQTEAKQLLQLMIHSLYSNREIFLRELISNASDAIDKLRLQVLANSELADDSEPAITIQFDADASTVTIGDNGVGMTREEVIANLGTIARSGTAEFVAGLSGDAKADSALIGQFGVGFYSGFIVADEMEVLTRSVHGGIGTRWRSTGEDDFSVADVEDLPRGTQVILHLREESKEFADDFRLRSIVRKYSDHLSVPVRMAKPVEPTPEPAEGEDESVVAEVSQEPELETVNEAKALWTRSRSDVSEEEYQEFYKHISHDFDNPIAWSHNRVEGKLEYTSLLYIPTRAPFDMWNREAPRGLKLYVQRVFILDEADQFLPMYLRFVKGVVDSNDLPLNVSREILQEDERVTSIRNALTKRVLTVLGDMSRKSPEDYQTFWDAFGEVLKEGAGEDFANRETIAKLLRFSSTSGDESKTLSLESYLERAPDEQDKIYYLVADSYTNAKNSPHLEVFKKQGIEVILMFDRIDEWLMGSMTEFDGKQFVDVMRGDIDLPGTDKDAEDAAEDDAPLTARMAEVLSDNVAKVRASKRLTDSPACLVLEDDAMGAQMRQIMASAGQSVPASKPILEYNAEHPLVQRMDIEADEDRFADLVHLLFDQAALADGTPLSDASAHVQRLNRLLVELLSD
jgi:molecular chaperone HtpG